MDNKELIIPSSQEVEVRNFERRIAEFLPGAKDVPQSIRLAMAQVAIAHGLDPFLKEVWPIPQKDRDRNIVGWDLMIGIAGWRSAAWRSNEYWGRRFEKCTPDERAWLGAQPNDIAIRCIVMRRRTGQQPMEFDGYGLYKTGHEFSKMNPLQCVRYRAERDAMKAAFPISLPVGIQAKVADEETGEIINGSHGIEWTEPLATREDASTVPFEIIDQPSAEEPQVEMPKASESPKPTAPAKPPFKKSSVRFDGMTPGEWHKKIDTFAAEHPNWQKDKRTDPDHILISAAHVGYEYVTGANVDEVLTAIVAAHEAKEKV